MLLAGLALACDDVPTAPRASVRPEVEMSGEGPRLFPNTVKYRDAGRKPATGRAGGASITTRALLGSDGTTVLEVWAGGQGGTGPGELWQVQVKKFDADGDHRATQVEHPRGGRALTLELHDMQRGEPVQVQALVRGASGPRTGVVTVRDVVWRRPDLMVAGIDAPARTWVHTPTFVTAVVRELRGDVGARTSCILDVDGVAVDEATGIWVDAGGAVTCAFAWTFDVPGERTLRVRLAGTEPYDDDPADDAATATVLVVTEVPLSYTARADSGTYAHWNRSTWQFSLPGPVPAYAEYFRDSSAAWNLLQSSRLDAWTRAPVAFPEEPLADVRVSQETGGATVHSAEWASLPADAPVITPDSSTGCATRASGGAVITTLTICTRRVGAESYTSLSYQWNATDATYVSEQRRTYVCRPPYTCPPSTYYLNTSHSATGTLVTFGPTFSFDVAFRSGTSVFTAAPVIRLVSMYTSAASPTSCGYGYAMAAVSPRAIVRSCNDWRYDTWQTMGVATRP